VLALEATGLSGSPALLDGEAVIKRMNEELSVCDTIRIETGGA
jgi:hypothetical protein